MADWDDHPLATMLIEAGAGRFPPVDGRVEVFGPDANVTHAVVSFTGHAVVLTSEPSDHAIDAADGYGAATDPRLLVHLAGSGSIGTLDLVLVRRSRDERDRRVMPLEPIDGFDDHPRVVRAREHRRDVTVLGDSRGLVCVGSGLAGRTEIAVELTDAAPGLGSGRELIAGALATIAARDAADLVFAQVAPGNAASVRAFLAAGFVPIASEVLFEPRPA